MGLIGHKENVNKRKIRIRNIKSDEMWEVTVS